MSSVIVVELTIQIVGLLTLMLMQTVERVTASGDSTEKMPVSKTDD